jgi:ankyrin repeat protein
MDSRQDRIEEAFAGTCEWLLGHDTLAQWCRQHRGLLWLKGNPGSGKSTIMQFALQEVPAIYDEKTIMISFFFHARGNELQKNPLGLYRSLLHQLLKCVPGALSDMVTYFEERRRTIGNEWKWEIRILQSFLESSLPRILERFPVILCIDALDECAENSAVKLIAYFKRLLSMLPSTNSRFGILLSCRHHPILELREGLTIRLEKENNADIANFVQAQLATSDVDPETQITICDRAQGVFIWAHMVVNRVLKLKRQGEPRNRIHAEIQKVPPDVDQLYQELIQDVEDRAAALKLMQWICFSTRPLTTDELRWAMAIDPDCTHKTLEACDHLSDLMTKDILETRACVHTDNDHTKKNYSSDCSSNNDFTNSIADPDIERRIKTLSCGLVEIVKSENRCIIQVIHQSVNDFFIDRGLRLLGQTNKSDSVGPAAHFILARSCTLYLRMFMASHPGRDYYLDRDAFPFLLYAATSGFSHVELSEPSEASLGILLEGFSHATGKFDESWPRLCRQLNSAGNWPGPGSNLVHVASMHGFVKLTSCLLRTTVGNIDSKDETGTTPLSLAVRKHPSIVEMLLETGKVDIDSRDNYGNTPLSHACWAGKDSVVKRLLKTGKVDIGSRNYYGNTPLSRACSAGKDSAVMMLLETGKVDIDSRDNNGNTPLSHACWAGKDSVVMMLLETGKVDIDSRDNNGNTPLSRACWAGKDSVVMMLLETGKVDIDSRNNYGDTPLSQACWAGKDSVVMMLLETGKVDIDSRDNDGETPLSRACWAGKDSVVMMLLETGKVDIDSRDNYGNTPLSHTCSAGKFSVVMMLLKTGKVDIDSRNNNGNTPLSRACWAGKDSVVMMLLETGKVDIDSRNNDGETPLSQACYAGKGSVVMMLLETGKVNVNSKCTKNGRTPLTWAVVGGRGAERQAVVVRILLSTATVDINLVDNIQGWTPLRWAGWLRKQAMVDMLRDAGGVDDDPSEPKFDCTA